jgi:hypothetical protein
MLLQTAVNTLAPTSSTLPTSIGVALVMGYILDTAKRVERIPKVSYYTVKLNALLRIIMSGIGTLGVTWVWSATGTGHQLLITFPAVTVILYGLWHWAIQYASQHMVEIQLQSGHPTTRPPA